MKRSSRASFAAAILALGLATSAWAQATLQFKHPEGTSTQVRTVKATQTLTIAGMDVKTEAESRATASVTVGKRMADGTLRIQEKTEGILFRLTAPGGFMAEYDSTKPENKSDIPQIQAIFDGFNALKGSTYTIVLDKDNKVTAVEGLQKIIETLPPAAAEAFKQEYDQEKIKRETQQSLNVLPDKPVKPGDRWQRTEVMRIGDGQKFTFDTNYEYIGTVEKGGRTLDKIGIFIGAVTYAVEGNAASPLKVVQSELKIESSFGQILFDRELGDVVERSTNTRITGPLTFEVNGMQLGGKLDLTLDASDVVKR
jgi:uncharacterized protein DUF6263